MNETTAINFRKEIDPSVKTFDSIQCEIDRQKHDDPKADVLALVSAQECIKIDVTKRAMNVFRAQREIPEFKPYDRMTAAEKMAFDVRQGIAPGDRSRINS